MSDSPMVPFTVDEIDDLISATAIRMTIPGYDWNRGKALLDKLRRWRDLQVKRDLVNARNV